MKTQILWAILLLGLGQGSMATAFDFAIKPYVFSTRGTGLSIAWQYDGNDPSPVELNLYDHQVLLKKIIPVADNELYVADLAVGTCGFGGELSYVVSGMKDPIKIENNPCPGEDGTIRFSFLADTQEGYELARRFSDPIVAFRGAAVIYGGDLVERGGEFDEWKYFFNAMEGVNGRQMMLPAVGNHEYKYDPDVPLWRHYFRNEARDGFYSAWIGLVHVIVLNSCFSDDPSLEVRELDWVDGELAVPAPWKVVVFHHPPYSEGIANNPLSLKKEYRELRLNFVPLFEKYGVDLVLNGHTHIFEHDFKDGVHYLINGPAGGVMGIYGAGNPYSMKSFRLRTMIQFEAGPRALRAVSTSVDGNVLDDFTLNK